MVTTCAAAACTHAIVMSSALLRAAPEVLVTQCPPADRYAITSAARLRRRVSNFVTAAIP